MQALVGYTGFVGSNLCASGAFDGLYNSKNIGDAYGAAPGLLVYAGLPAAKFLANSAPEKDREAVCQAERNIEAIAPEKLVLISTIDVFPDPRGVDESSPIDPSRLAPYGAHRYQLEQWVRGRYPDALIVRLPGLFGKNLKKNFLFDFLHPIPSMLTEKKLAELMAGDREVGRYYGPPENGFCRLLPLDGEARSVLLEKMEALGFTALHFTDSRSVYQFYPLGRLWGDIQTALGAGLRLWHPAAEPVSAGEVYHFLTGGEFHNHLPAPPADYDYRTRFDTLFGGAGGYICDKSTILREIQEYVTREQGAG